MNRRNATPGLLAVVLSVVLGTGLAGAQNIRGSAEGPTTAKGYSHPDQFMHVRDVKPADNMYPVVPHPEQDQAARSKLAELEKRFGKKPNLLVFIMDDVAWMDPGFNGGGVAVGNDTPTMDRFANEGLVLTSAYSTPSCTPTRATVHTGQNPLHHGLLRPPMYGEAGRTRRRGHAAGNPQEAGVRDARRREMAHGGEQGVAAAERRLRRLSRLPRCLGHVHRVARRLLQPGNRPEPRAFRDGAELSSSASPTSTARRRTRTSATTSS